MMTAFTTDDMRNALARVAEEAIFVCVDDPPAGAAWPNHLLMARVELRDPHDADVILVAIPDWCSQMAASFEGSDEPRVDSEVKRDDAFRELLNMVCGILVGDESTPSGQPCFGIPNVDVIARKTLDDLLSTSTRHVMLQAESGEPIALLLVGKAAHAS